MQIPLDELEYDFSVRPDSDPELGHYLLSFRGRAMLWDDELGDERVVGEIRGQRIDLATAAMDSYEQSELLQMISADITEFADKVLTAKPGHYLHRDADGTLHDETYDGLVFIHEVKVDPALRGQNIGSELFRRMGETLNIENSLIGLKAFPLSERLGERVDERLIPKVKQFYERLGFIAETDNFMVKEGSHCVAIEKRIAWRQSQQQMQQSSGVQRHAA